MARRRHVEEHENHERWLVSYADFITLLFAFFVVMYSVSSVNEGKFRVLSDAMVATFKDPRRSVDPIQVGELVRSPSGDAAAGEGQPAIIDPIRLPLAAVPRQAFDPAMASEPAEMPTSGDVGGPSAAAMAGLEAVASRVEGNLAPLILSDMVAVRREQSWIEVEFNTAILFASGEARLSTEAEPVLAEVAAILAEFPNPVQVEGFTDDIPINTATFRSNWELSAARAASVVHLFTRAGIRPDRMVAIGYGEHRPIADNSTIEGRRRNRRVVVVIPAEEEARRTLDLERLLGPPTVN